jgi:hypothetical protein
LSIARKKLHYHTQNIAGLRHRDGAQLVCDLTQYAFFVSGAKSFHQSIYCRENSVFGATRWRGLSGRGWAPKWLYL